jgi:hypothetical protein
MIYYPAIKYYEKSQEKEYGISVILTFSHTGDNGSVQILRARTTVLKMVKFFF